MGIEVLATNWQQLTERYFATTKNQHCRSRIANLHDSTYICVTIATMATTEHTCNTAKVCVDGHGAQACLEHGIKA
jgi:hypothetical protein